MPQDKIPSVKQLVAVAANVVELFSYYDDNGNRKLDVEELGVNDDTEKQKAWAKLCKESNCHGGLKLSDVQRLLMSDESAMEEFLQFGIPSSMKVLAAITPKLERMPRGTAVAAIATLRDFMIDLESSTTRGFRTGTIDKTVYDICMDCVIAYLKAAAENQTPEGFLETTKKLYAVNRRSKNIMDLVDKILKPDEIHKQYAGLIKGQWLAYDKEKNALVVEGIPKGKKNPKKDSKVQIAIYQSNGKRGMSFNDAKKYAPWIELSGRFWLLRETLLAAEELRGAKIPFKGGFKLEVTDVIKPHMVMAVVYAERVSTPAAKANTPDEAKDAMSGVDFRLALEGPKAYQTEKSGVGASGFVQLMEGTHGDVNKRRCNADGVPYLPKSFSKTVGDHAESLKAAFLTLSLKAERLGGYFAGKKNAFDDIKSFLLGETIRDACMLNGALAMLYNGASPFGYLKGKKDPSSYGKAAINVVEVLIWGSGYCPDSRGVPNAVSIR